MRIKNRLALALALCAAVFSVNAWGLENSDVIGHWQSNTFNPQDFEDYPYFRLNQMRVEILIWVNDEGLLGGVFLLQGMVMDLRDLKIEGNNLSFVGPAVTPGRPWVGPVDVENNTWNPDYEMSGEPEIDKAMNLVFTRDTSTLDANSAELKGTYSGMMTDHIHLPSDPSQAEMRAQVVIQISEKEDRMSGNIRIKPIGNPLAEADPTQNDPVEASIKEIQRVGQWVVLRWHSDSLPGAEQGQFIGRISGSRFTGHLQEPRRVINATGTLTRQVNES